MLEAQVHCSLRDFLRVQDENAWPHHLTLARLVARALRLRRSALLQTATQPATYALSYLTSIALAPETVVLVLPREQQALIRTQLATLQDHLETHKPVWVTDTWRYEPGDPNSSAMASDFYGILLTTPEQWLRDRVRLTTRADRLSPPLFPPGLPTLIDGVDDLETWAREALTQTLTPRDWAHFAHQCPTIAAIAQATYDAIERSLRDRPVNPYGNYPLDCGEDAQITELLTQAPQPRPTAWMQFAHQWQQAEQLRWATLAPEPMGFNLHVAPIAIAPLLAPVWQHQPVVWLGQCLGLERQDGQFMRDRFGLGEVTTVKFAPQRQTDLIQLYVPDRLPLPNTQQFQTKLVEQLLRLCQGGMLGQRYGRHRPPEWISPLKRPVVVLVEDTPLRAQVSAALAAEFGSSVQLESESPVTDGIMVSGWDFWRQHQFHLETPQLLAIATLPIPSMEDPLVAGQVQHLKQRRQDWFQQYLLPITLQDLQRAVLPVREGQGVVALLDNRVNHRSYGAHIFRALEPYARINYIDFTS